MAVSGVALLSGAMALAQQQPMGGAPSTSQPTNPNAGMNGAQGVNGAQGMNEPPMQAMQDKEFVQDALQGGMAEVQLGQLAAQKGSTADVRQFGQRMVQDHSQLNNLMKQVAAKLEMHSPKGPSKKEKKLYDKLSGLSGTQFDDAYVKAMVKDHTDDLETFRREANESQNPAVKQAAEQGAQVIQQHLDVIKKIARSDNVKG
jgi:putative membrane protein